MKRCSWFIVGALAFNVLGCASSIVENGDYRAPGLDPKYARFIDEATRMTRDTMARSRIPGLSIVLASSKGIIWEAGFGYADDARSIPVDPQTMFSIQSMSKTFTALGVLTAVRDKKLDLDSPISRYLPGFRVQSIFEDHPENRITLRHLLTHTAGFTHEAPRGNNYSPEEPSFDEHAASIEDTWLMFRVGERYSYSNLGIDLAGYAVEKATGRPFVDYMKEEVFQPLSLSRTTMDPAFIKSETNRATGHQRGCKNLPVCVPMVGAGGVYTSAHDLGKLLTCMLQRGTSGAASFLPAWAFTEMETTPNHGGYGLGIAIGRREEDLYFNHGGGGYGFLSYMAWHPTLDIGVAVLTNSADHNSAHVALAEKLVDKLAASGLARKAFSLPYLPVCGINLAGVKDDGWYFDAHPEKTAWKQEWSSYLGSYSLHFNADPLWYAKLIMALGIPRSTYVKVSRQGRGMALDGVALLEQEPGLFFTKLGEALDFRSDPPTWRNIRLSRR
ncbi:MAG: serine hydrolase domain-containing protein [Spirochaetia bacterium]|jgi:CubicO group peptidase (beta-lactamase class C family)